MSSEIELPLKAIVQKRNAMKTVIRSVHVIVGAIAFWSSCMSSAQTLADNTKTLPPFTKVFFDVSGDLEIIPSPRFSYSIRAEQKVATAIVLEVSKDSLRIFAPNGYRTSQAVKITLHVPTLAMLTSEASGNLLIGAIECQRFKLVASGSGSVNVPSLACARLDLNATGAGDILMAGRTDTLAIESSGSGLIDARSLVAADVSVKQLGSGDISVHATRSLTGVLDGAGDLRFRGPAKPSVTINGAGGVRKLP